MVVSRVEIVGEVHYDVELERGDTIVVPDDGEHDGPAVSVVSTDGHIRVTLIGRSPLTASMLGGQLCRLAKEPAESRKKPKLCDDSA